MQKKILVIQPLPGVGDMIWHIPHLRAIRRMVGADAHITLLTKRRSRADALFGYDPVVDAVLWLDQKDGPNLAQGNVLRLAQTLRPHQFDRLYVLHHSPRYMMAGWLAGIPERLGYGFGIQWLWSNRGISLPSDMRRRHPIHKASAFIAGLGEKSTETDGLLVPAPILIDQVRQKLTDLPQPWLGLGIGSSEAYKQYGADALGRLALALLGQGWRQFLLLGGPPEQEIADHIVAVLAPIQGVKVVSVLDWPLDEVIAAQAQCAAYIGNDTGFLNISAALAVPSWGLFGATEPLFHSSHIYPIVPEQGFCAKTGMTRLDPDMAAQTIGGPNKRG